MASPTQWTWVWASSGSWWWTGKLGVLQSMGSQRVGHDWATELNWFNSSFWCHILPCFQLNVYLIFYFIICIGLLDLPSILLAVLKYFMCICKSWTVKKAECQRIDALKLWCCRRLWKASWIARRSNQSILKEINPEYSLEGVMMKLKLQSFGHLTWIANSLEKTLMLAKIEGKKRTGRQGILVW